MANALLAAGIATALGIGADSIAAGIGALARVPGRFEIVATGKDCTVVVDYAHTPDGVAAVIGTARALVGERAGDRRASAPEATATGPSAR